MMVMPNDFARDVNADSIADGIDLGLFHDKYTEFVGFVRGKRPTAHIFLAVSPMVSDKFPLDNARKNFRDILYTMAAEFDAKGDHKVYALEFLEMGSRYGLGCDYHPNLTVHQIMSDQLVGAMASLVHEARSEEPVHEGVVIIRPEAEGARVERLGDHEFRLLGRQVERVVALNDVTTPEALSYIDHQLKRLSVPRLLSRAGATDGDTVWIAGFSFEYQSDT